MGHDLLQRIIGLMLVILFVVGCGGISPTIPVAEAPAATPMPSSPTATPFPPTTTPTPEPPTSTPVPPTATPTNTPTLTPSPVPPTATPTNASPPTSSEGFGVPSGKALLTGALGADVVSVEVTGSPNAYQFSVGIASPDEGCHQYANWWEVLTKEGELVHRRILDHSHVNEQPFVRSGGPVAIGADTIVVVRAHMHPGGYGGKVMRGTVQTGFEEMELESDFAAEVESEPPQPTGCAF